MLWIDVVLYGVSSVGKWEQENVSTLSLVI